MDSKEVNVAGIKDAEFNLHKSFHQGVLACLLYLDKLVEYE